MTTRTRYFVIASLLVLIVGLGTGLVAAYLFARHDLDLSVPDSRTVALTTLIAGGLYLVMALEAGGSLRRSTLVATMCAVMAALYVAALLIPAVRSFYALTAPDLGMIATALGGAGLSIWGLWVCGFTLRAAPVDAAVS